MLAAPGLLSKRFRARGWGCRVLRFKVRVPVHRGRGGGGGVSVFRLRFWGGGRSF